MRIWNSEQEYGSVAKFFHWFIGIGIILMLAVGCVMGDLPRAIRGSVYNAHKCAGIIILCLVLLRVVWRFMNVRPLWPVSMPAIQQFAAKISHLLLYAFMFIMPLTGWLMSTASGRNPNLFGIPLIMPGVGLSDVAAGTANRLHYIFAWSLLAVVAIHIVAAWKHHLVDKDNIMRRMLPRKKRD